MTVKTTDELAHLFSYVMLPYAQDECFHTFELRIGNRQAILSKKAAIECMNVLAEYFVAKQIAEEENREAANKALDGSLQEILHKAELNKDYFSAGDSVSFTDKSGNDWTVTRGWGEDLYKIVKKGE